MLIMGCLALPAVFARSQDMAVKERDLLSKLQRIDYWRSYGDGHFGNSVEDSLEKANRIFQDALVADASQYSSSIGYPFQLLKKAGLTIATSSDHRFRIYSWDTWEGGTMHFFRNVDQWVGGDKIYAKAINASATDPADPGVFCTPIYTFATSARTYYLVVNSAMYSTKDDYEGIQAYCIANRTLDDSVPIFRTQSGLKSSIGFNFDFFSVVGRPERPMHLIEFDITNKMIRIPVVLGNGIVTRRWIRYQWTGKYFERIR